MREEGVRSMVEPVCVLVFFLPRLGALWWMGVLCLAGTSCFVSFAAADQAAPRPVLLYLVYVMVVVMKSEAVGLVSSILTAPHAGSSPRGGKHFAGKRLARRPPPPLCDAHAGVLRSRKASGPLFRPR